MNDCLASKISCIDQMLENGDYSNAVSILHELVKEYPSEGIIPYYLGRICLISRDETLACKYFATAIKMGYTSSDVYLSLAFLEKNLTSVNEAEKSFLKAIDSANTSELKWICLSCLSVFYIENEMYLKADKYVKKIIAEYPNSYQGYHLHIMIEALRNHLDEAFAYMDKLPDIFKRHPQYLIDVIDIYKKSGKENELSDLFNSNLRFSDIIPQIVLREKISSMPNDENDDNKEQLIRKLANEHHDKDAILSMMIMEFSRKNFEKSSKIANIILENEKENQGIKYYLALYFQIYNLYYLAGKKPSVKLRKWIGDAGIWCINFAEELNIPTVTDMVRNSIQELFDEINRNGNIQK